MASGLAGTGGVPRAPGRPRDPDRHRAVLDAAVALFIAVGYEGMTMEAVAARAGVAKTTVYRRWPAKQDLVVEAVGALSADVADPDTGDVRADLVALLVRIQRLFATSPVGEVFPRMAAEVAIGSPLGRAYLERVITPRMAVLKSILARGVARGELPADLDLAVAADMLMGPIVLAALTRRLSVRGAARRATQIVDLLIPAPRRRRP